MGRHRTVFLFFLLRAITDRQAAGQTLDVCATCHVNAKCDDKSDGSGKVCNCMYGFVGNGRTFCQDKDECQIGANMICGQHTSCHNTYGSYYCTCLAGYSPTNNMDIFIPNDGTHCQDVDECRIPGLCGEGAQCRNLEGSFDCSCQLGYQVHDGAEPFHPQTGKASCKVIDCGQPPSVEDIVLLSATGTRYSSVAMYGCDEGFIWRSGSNSSVCGADGRWTGLTMVCEEADCGSPPAHPHSHMLWNKASRMGSKVIYQCASGYHNVGGGNVSVCTASGQWEDASVLCQEIQCGIPPPIEYTDQIWNGSSTCGSTVVYSCKVGFYNKSGINLSLCTENGHWTQPTLSCQEISCGNPAILPHAGKIWNGSSTPGTTVLYYCKLGFYYKEGNNMSLCTVSGYWTKPNISCKEVDCGGPPDIPNAFMLWDKSSRVGAHAVYSCNTGYHNVGGGNVSVCSVSGEWDGTNMVCQEIKCGEPLFKPHTKTVWDNTTHIGSVFYYQCNDGYYTENTRNYSVCQENGLWEDIDFWCEEINCGSPLTLPNTNLLWNHTSRPGSVVVYVCTDEFYQESGHAISTCSKTGKWGEVSIKCKAKCGPVPFLNNSEVVWHNRSAVIHRCVDGYHSWRGSNFSVCGNTGVWLNATLRCIEIKPAINALIVFNEKCLRWKAEKYENDTESYKVVYMGSREYQRSFHDNRKRLITSSADQLKICLNLLPATNYTISITAVSVRFTVTVTTYTSLQVPQVPVTYFREVDTPFPTLRLRRTMNTLDPISLYQVYVIPLEETMVFDCTSPGRPDVPSNRETLKEYITAQIQVSHVGTEFNFTVGDGLHYGGFFNAPLQNGGDYYVILRAVSQWKGAFKSNCVLWAKVNGTSYVLRISSLSAAGSIGLVLVILGGYTYSRFFKKTHVKTFLPETS